jgi:hypothetical protein
MVDGSETFVVTCPETKLRKLPEAAEQPVLAQVLSNVSPVGNGKSMFTVPPAFVNAEAKVMPSNEVPVRLAANGGVADKANKKVEFCQG